MGASFRSDQDLPGRVVGASHRGGFPWHGEGQRAEVPRAGARFGRALARCGRVRTRRQRKLCTVRGDRFADERGKTTGHDVIQSSRDGLVATMPVGTNHKKGIHPIVATNSPRSAAGCRGLSFIRYSAVQMSNSPFFTPAMNARHSLSV